MDNLFPAFRTFSLEATNGADGEQTHGSGWDPSRLNGSGTQSMRVLERGGPPKRRQPSIVKRIEPRLPRPAPNDTSADFVLEEMSPLCKTLRGVPDPVQIVGPKIMKEKRRQTKEEELNQLRVVLNIYNKIPVSHEIFSHSQTTVHSIELKEDDVCFRMAGTLKPQLEADTPEGNVLPVFLSTPKIAAVFMSSRQEIKDFQFNPGPIGLVVELKGSKLLCTKVMPHSQCSFHEQAIVGSEVIAVNGLRVLTLQSFVEEIRKAQHFKDRFINIKVSAFRGGRMKLDEMLSFSKRNKKITSLLGNMFTKGLDKDHSHGIELPAPEESSDESGESEDGHEGNENDAGDEEAGLFDPEPVPDVENLPPVMEEDPQIDEPETTDANDNISGTYSSRPNSQRYGKRAMMDDNSSMGSSTTKKKFMEVYRGDSDDEDSMADKQSQQEEDLSKDNESLDSCDVQSQANDGISVMTGADMPSEDIYVSRSQTQEAAEQPSGDQSEERQEPRSGAQVSLVQQLSREENKVTVALPRAAAPDIEVECMIPAATMYVGDTKEQSSPEGVRGNDNDESDSDDEIINEELAAKIKGHGIVNALEEMATGEELPIVLQDEKDDDEGESDQESEPGDVWDYATVLEGQDYSPFRCLVCVPKSLEKSANGWGNPQSFLHFANFSTEWYLEVFWVDHESLLVPRVKLRCGERHNEMTSPDLVWCIIATYIEKKNRKRRVIEDDGDSVGGDSNVIVPAFQIDV